jgi:autotransporter translocation and assembly factor TamB
MRFARRALQVVAFTCTLIVGVASMAAIVTQTAWFKDWLRGFVVRQAGDYVNGQLSIAQLGGNLFFGVELTDVAITVDGQTVVGIRDVGLDFNAFTMLSGGVVLDDIRVNQPVVRLQHTAQGWSLAHLFKARTPDPDQPKNRRTIEIGEVGISAGTLYIDEGPVGTSGVDLPAKIERLDASFAVKSNEDELTFEIAHLSFRAAEPDFGVNAMSGVVRRTPDMVTLRGVALQTEESSLRVDGEIKNIEGSRRVLSLMASSDKLAFAEFAKLLPALRGYALQPAFELSATGPMDALAVNLNLRDGQLGHALADVMIDAIGPNRRIAGNVDVEHFNVASVLRAPVTAGRGGPSGPPVHTDITGRAQIDLALPSGHAPLSGTYSATATDVQVAGYRARNVVADGRVDGRVVRVNARADAYGGHATAAGTVHAGPSLELDLKGHATRVDMRNLPVQLKMPGVPSTLSFDYTLAGRGRVFSGDVRLDESTLAGATIAAGTTGQFRIGGGAAPEYAAKGQVDGLDVQQVGRGFAIQAIATDKYRSRITATFDVTGSGGGRYPLTLDATGTAVDSGIFGASFPKMDVTASFTGGDAKIRAVGQFAQLNPAVVTGNERLAADLTGAVNAETTIRAYARGVTVDSLDVAGRVDLGRSSIGDLAIETAVVDGRYANREGQLTTLEVAGPDVHVSGQGAIALNDTGSSNLTLHAESPSLDRIGQIVGQPFKGAATIDARITGNARELKAQGTLKGSNIGHGESEALSLASAFTATMPDLTPANATVQAQSTATLLEIAGQQLTELRADTTYFMKTLQFDAIGKEGVRELQAAGRAVFHPEHQEIHLSNIALRVEQIQWQTAPGSDATLNYAKGRLAIEKLQLVSGDQRITADGVVGSPAEVLRVRAENVDVAQLDQLLLGDQRLAGRLSADATVTGELAAPRVEGEFTLTKGAFRAFTFDSLGGKADYAERGMNIDVRLQQTPAAWLTARGYVPLPLFRGEAGAADATGAVGHDEPGPGEGLDVQIASSDIDLSVVEGFTSYLTSVTGVMQANVRVTGTGRDPHLDGAIEIRGGAFAVAELGTNYTGLDTRLDLKPEGLTIREFRILDNRGFPMTVGGTLATHAQEGGAVNITVKSSKFEVIDNQFADLKLNTDIRITGELRAPKLEGGVEVETGTIQVARLLEWINARAYSTEGAELNGRAAPPGPPGLYEALEMDIGLIVPSNLVLQGSDLRPTETSISVGDMSITVGGAVQVRKTARADIRVLGEVNTVRGSYSFQGRRFEVMRDGRIRFDGGDVIDPIIDIRARRIISGVETFVRVQGTMRQPELTFASNPPLDQADILSLIVFNTPVNELGEGQQVNLAQRAGALASGYLTSSLARSIGSALELDEFEIQAAGDNGAGPSISVGEQVGEKLFVRVRQAFGDAQATEFILEYQLADFLRLQATAAETSSGTQRLRFRRVERGGIDLIFFFSY